MLIEEADSMNPTTSSSHWPRRVWRMIGIGLACVVILAGVWSLEEGNRSWDKLGRKQTYAHETTIAKTARKGENCVKSLQTTLGKWDAQRESLLTSFPLSPKLVVSFEKSDGTSKKMNRAQIEQDVANPVQEGKKYALSNVRRRLNELGKMLKKPHKRMTVDSSHHLILLEDNAVVSIDADACQVDGVYFNRREGVHRDVRQVVEDNMAVAQDSGSPTPAPTPATTCPLVTGHDACRKMPKAQEIYDATTTIDNTLQGIDTLNSLVGGILGFLGKMPKLSIAFGVLNSVLGFLGNEAMSPESALNEAKKYTDELVDEVYNCMDHEFARSWTNHIRVQLEDIQDAIEGVSILNYSLERIHHTWEPASQACNSLGNKYRMFLEEYNREESADFLIGQTPGVLQTCGAVYMQYMVDILKMGRRPRGYDALKVKLDMHRAIGDIDAFMKVGIAALDANYRKSSVCGNKLSLVDEKMKYLYQDVYLPAVCMSSSLLGGKVIRDAYEHYPNHRIDVNANTDHMAILRSEITDPKECIQACLEDNACLSAQYRKNEQDCLGFDRTLWAGLHQRTGDEFFVFENRHKNAMVVNPNIPNSRAYGASICLYHCLLDSLCGRADASTGSCVKNGGTEPNDSIDYVVFHNALLVAFENYEWTGPKPSFKYVGVPSVLHCLSKCQGVNECKAIDYDGVNLICWTYRPWDTYPGMHTLDRRLPSEKFIHYDIHSYSAKVLYQPLVSRQSFDRPPRAADCSSTDLALNKPTGESLDHPQGNTPKTSAVDGVIDYNKCALVAPDSYGQVWWYVDLGAEYEICSVTISFPPTSSPEYMDDISLFVTDRKPSGRFSAFQSEACRLLTGFTGTKTFQCEHKAVGRYVGLDNQKVNPQFLLLCEVQVTGTLKPN